MATVPTLTCPSQPGKIEQDFRTNLLAELEIRSLHDKMDYLVMHQWQRLLEIQEIQMDLMEEVSKRKPDDTGGMG